MTLRTSLFALFAGTALTLSLACGGGGGGGSTPAPATIVVTVAPTTASILTGGTQTFTATVTGTTDTAVTWSVQEAAGGSVNASGLYTAPGTPGTYHVVATSHASATKTASATVTVSAPPATSLTYTDPSTGTYQVKKNAGLSTSTHIVFDVVGSGAPTGAGLAFSLTADATRLTWAKVAPADPEYIQNGAVLTLGSAPLPLKGKVTGNVLVGGLGQKGLAGSVALNGVLTRFAVDLKAGAPTGAAALAQTKAQVLQSDGTLATVTLTFGTLTAN